MADYKEAPLATRPSTLDPKEYYHLTPAQRRAAEERLAIRARLKREFQLQLNNPLQRGVIEDTAMTRWTYARSANIYPNFRPTPKTSLLGFLAGVVPLFFWYYAFKTERDHKEKLIQEGKYERPFRMSY
ncbi:NADH dehydrogenase [ubiquinone] 1 beta subcomplex subunit 4 [Protopterus annectens]|uniref:NADH dehydrogenase [ubiquinone] 1 beta subcomplex subunit 4 n=1 Tax=Protopterus annectens TaxID=7888 RepID=UPI001CFA53DD|nr:NADH dehydrogenase [ubiquinone] 1 beta subcomplex subunit 4 [Protopterus annectens]